MATEIKLKFLAAGTYGYVNNRNTDTNQRSVDKRYAVPFHCIVLNDELLIDSDFNRIFEKFPDLFVLDGDFPEAGMIAMPARKIKLLVEHLIQFLAVKEDSFTLRPACVTSLFEELVTQKLLKEEEATIYFNALPTTNTIDDKKDKAEREHNAALAIDVAKIEKENGRPSLAWILKAKKYDPKHEFFKSPNALNHFIVDICLTEFKQLFDDVSLPYWLLNAKANIEKNQSQLKAAISDDAFSLVLTSSQTGAPWSQRIRDLKQAKMIEPNHRLFSKPIYLASYLVGIDEETLWSLFLEGRSSYWLLESLSLSSSKTAITLRWDVLDNAEAIKSIYYFLSNVNHLIDLRVPVSGEQNTARIVDMVFIIEESLRRLRSLHKLDVSGLQIGDRGLSSLLDVLKNLSPHNFQILNVKNCALSDKSFDSLIDLIEKCGSIKNVLITGNDFLPSRQEDINGIIERNSPINFIRRHFSSTDVYGLPQAKSNGSLFDENQTMPVSMTTLMKNGGTDDLFLDNNRELICSAVDKALNALDSSLTILKSSKFKPLNALKVTFNEKSDIGSFKALLEELTDSKWRDKKGFTGSFQLFINNITSDVEEYERLLSLINSLLMSLREEKNINLSDAIDHMSVLLKAASILSQDISVV